MHLLPSCYNLLHRPIFGAQRYGHLPKMWGRGVDYENGWRWSKEGCQRQNYNTYKTLTNTKSDLSVTLTYNLASCCYSPLWTRAHALVHSPGSVLPSPFHVTIRKIFSTCPHRWHAPIRKIFFTWPHRWHASISKYFTRDHTAGTPPFPRKYFPAFQKVGGSRFVCNQRAIELQECPRGRQTW